MGRGHAESQHDGELAPYVFDSESDGPVVRFVLDGDRTVTPIEVSSEVLRVLKPVSQPSKYWMFIPALLLLALVIFLQRGRAARGARRAATA